MVKYRYPSSIAWDNAYRDGFQEFSADSLHSALNYCKVLWPNDNNIDHLQMFVDDRWKFAKVILNTTSC